mgnify:CR=1 FL=1
MKVLFFYYLFIFETNLRLHTKHSEKLENAAPGEEIAAQDLLNWSCTLLQRPGLVGSLIKASFFQKDCLSLVEIATRTLLHIHAF